MQFEMLKNLFFSYCQGTGIITASLLLLLEEEDAFWIMVTIVEDLLPASYYSSTLIGMYYVCNKSTLGPFNNCVWRSKNR